MTKDIVHVLRGLIDPASECLSDYNRINEFCQAAEKAIEEIGTLRTEKHGDAEGIANLERALEAMTSRAVKAEAELAALRDDAALTVAYMAGVQSERDRAKIASEGP